MSENLPERIQNKSEILFYQTEDGSSLIQVRLEDKTAWLSQKAMSELFQTTIANINIHLTNIFSDTELDPNSVIKENLITAADGKSYKTKLYRLEAIIAVGYRVKSHRGTQFRRWATERLREYLIKGFVLDDERLKNPKEFGADYFDELLERIRDIRASEKKFYQKIRDIYALAVDYAPEAPETHEFFQIVQNKLHWAVAGKTAPEIIHERADAAKNNMGLTSWKGAKVRKTDVAVAKNYLKADEVRKLDRLAGMYLDFAEERAEEGVPLHMKDWRGLLDEFLKFNRKAILSNSGKVKKEVADAFARKQYGLFNANRIKREAEIESESEISELERQAKMLEHKPKRKMKKE